MKSAVMGSFQNITTTENWFSVVILLQNNSGIAIGNVSISTPTASFPEPYLSRGILIQVPTTNTGSTYTNLLSPITSLNLTEKQIVMNSTIYSFSLLKDSSYVLGGDFDSDNDTDLTLPGLNVNIPVNIPADTNYYFFAVFLVAYFPGLNHADLGDSLTISSDNPYPGWGTCGGNTGTYISIPTTETIYILGVG